MAPSVTTLPWKEQRKDEKIWCWSRFPATLMTGARASSCREPLWRGDKRLSTQMMRSLWHRVIICPFLPLPVLFIFCSQASFSWIFHYDFHWLDEDHCRPRTQPPTNQTSCCQFACDSSVSTNAFRLGSTCFFFSFCWLLLNCSISRL